MISSNATSSPSPSCELPPPLSCDLPPPLPPGDTSGPTVHAPQLHSTRQRVESESSLTFLNGGSPITWNTGQVTCATDDPNGNIGI